MKTRLSFVSNSSSTSYVVTTTKKNFDKVLKKSNEVTKLVIESLKKNKYVISEKHVFGKDLVVLEYSSGDYNGEDFSSIDLSAFEEDEKLDDLDPLSVLMSFVEELSKDKKNFIESSVDGPPG